jgi:predicted enzyme related to lactoylglutathione lyase
VFLVFLVFRSGCPLIYNPGMPQVDKHAPGDFCWIELGTSDQDAAKHFYGSLFGWVANDMPMGPDSFYTIFRLDGRDSSAAYTLTPQETDQKVPPHWNLYIALENADDAANKAVELGAKLLAPAFDVFDAGRMAVIQDPTGAIFTVWQAKKNAGIGINNEPGALCWADLNTQDRSRAKEFYSALFGWTITAGEGKDDSGYLHIQNGERFIGGMPPAPNGPPHWMIYFNVADVDDSAANAKELGANFYIPPTSMEGVGRLTVLADPQGAVFAMFKESPRN